MNDFLIPSSEQINQTETVDKTYLHRKNKRNPLTLMKVSLIIFYFFILSIFLFFQDD